MTPADEVSEPLERRRLRVGAAALTDLGMVRERNEDAFHVDPEGQFFIVADGMGGQAGGQIASQMAVELVRRRLAAARPLLHALAAGSTERARDVLRRLLGELCRAANDAVYRRAQREPELARMGTTLEIVVVVAGEAYVAHVGDGRTYLVRGGTATQLTIDHTMAEVMVAAGTMTPAEAATSAAASMLVSAIGVTPELTVQLVEHTLEPGDRLLVCSDGLYQYFAVEELARLTASATAEAAIHELVALARVRGGHDNITGVVLDVGAPGSTRRFRALGTERPRPPMALTPELLAVPPPVVPPRVPPPRAPRAETGHDAWPDDETTIPREPLEPPAPRRRRTLPPDAQEPNPLESCSEDTLVRVVEAVLAEVTSRTVAKLLSDPPNLS